ncbi:MAG TPA: ester cyclase [Chloroflexota bacterium]|jgi:steroid delta-isomerase-like uncharacterized protein
MSIETNKLAVRRYFDEIWNEGHLELIDTLFTDDYRGNISIYADKPVVGREGMRELVAMFLSGFPDFRATVLEQVGEGDTVVTQWTGQGTHEGDIMGVPLTHKVATIQGVMIAHFANGQMVRVRCTFDVLSLVQQLGFAPSLDLAQTPVGRAAFWLLARRRQVVIAGAATAGLVALKLRLGRTR